MILIYVEKISPRFTYIIKHIFNKMLGVEYSLTSDAEAFILSDEAKISYGKSPIGNEFFIENFGLLYERGISKKEIEVQYWNNIPYFFPTKKASLPFDLFSASFYLLSRYEEYFSHFKEENRPYQVTDSLAYKHQFLKLPLVDIWVKRLAELLQQKYPNLQCQSNHFRQLSLIEVAQAYLYKNKGVIRTIASLIRNVSLLQFSKSLKQILTIMRLRNDPYDNYDKLIQFHQKYNINTIFFFLIAPYTLYDRGLSPYSRAYRELIKKVADYSVVSVLASYASLGKVKKYRAERKMMIHIINRPVRRILLNINKLQIPQTYQNIAEAEYNEDYNMGYENCPGFRASTCTPFHFYDLSSEVQLPLKINPYCFHNQSLKKIKNKKEAFKIISLLKKQIHSVNGEFITVSSYEIMCKKEKYMEFYKEMLTLDIQTTEK